MCGEEAGIGVKQENVRARRLDFYKQDTIATCATGKNMSEIPHNIQRFNLIVLVVFNELYESFPSGIEIDHVNMGCKALPRDQEWNDQAWDFMADARHVVKWLAEEGFLRCETSADGNEFYDVRLTMKGLTVLGYTPIALEDGDSKETAIVKVKSILSRATEKAVTSKASDLLGQMFSLTLIKDLGSSIF